MNYGYGQPSYGYEQPGYGYGAGIPPMSSGYGQHQSPIIPPQGQFYQPSQGQYGPQMYGAPMQGFGGYNPVVGCPKCGGTGYRWKKGRNKRCKCIKEQAKRMGRRRDFSSSSSD